MSTLHPLNHKLGTNYSSMISLVEISTYVDPSIVIKKYLNIALNIHNLLTTIIEFLLPGMLPMPSSPIITLDHMVCNINIIYNYI